MGITATLLFAFAAHAQNALPAAVRDQLNVPVEKMGSSTYRRFGFGIYRATLWAPDGIWDSEDPYVLELRYLRDLSKDTIVDTTLDDIRDQHAADAATFARWEPKIRDTLPAVKEGDVLIGVAIPGEKTLLFLNGEKIAEIRDEALSRAFFNIWLGESADEEMKMDLLKRDAQDKEPAGEK